MPPRKKKESSGATPVQANASDKLAATMAAVEKVLKPNDIGAVDLDTFNLKKSHPHLPTGSLICDYVIGGRPNMHGVPPCPGLPRGRLVNLYGMESSGKTTLALTAAATTIMHGGQVIFIDWENAIDPRYAESLGVPHDKSKFMLTQPPTLEMGIGVIHAAAKAGVELIIIDSVSAGVPQAVMNQDLKSIGDIGQMGLCARVWSNYLPKLKEAVSKSGTCVIGISQLRDTIGKMGPGEHKVAAGGNAWKFYSELRIMLRRVSTEMHSAYNPLTHKMEEAPLGNIVRIEIDKCKVAPTQKAKAEFFLRYGEGIDDVRSILAIAIAHGLVVKSSSWYSWVRKGGEEIKAQGLEPLRKIVLDTPGLWKELYQSTLKQLNEAAMNQVPSTEEGLDEDSQELLALTGGALGEDDEPEGR